MDTKTNPRRAEATKDKYQVEIQTIKLTRNKHPKRLQVKPNKKHKKTVINVVKHSKKEVSNTHNLKTCNGIKQRRKT
jgi:hypothetical protein